MRASSLSTALLVACLACCIARPGEAGPRREMWLDVPYVKQSPEGCGSACAAMVIRYWDVHVPHHGAVREDEASIFRKLYSPKAEGIPAVSLEQYLKDQGFRVFVFKGAWQDLEEHLSKGRPLIVCVKGGSSHYMVVTGIDPDRGVVLVNDPARQKLLKLKRMDFEKGWAGSGNWTLLALP